MSISRKLACGLLAVGAPLATAGALALASSSSAAPSSGGSLPVLKLALNGKTVKVSGSKVSGAVTVQTTVTKAKAGEPTLFQFAPGKGPADFGKCAAQVAKHHGDPNYLDPCGRILFDAAAPKGKSKAQTILYPGKWIALNTQNAKGAPPHAFFTVSKSSSPAKLPKPGATIATIEFGFRGADKLHDGELVRFVNDGFLVHMDVFGQAKNVKDAKKAIRLLKAGKDGKANKLFIGGGAFAGPLSTGGLQQLVVNEKPGVYVQACFMDTQDGREHTQLGMERMFKIVK